MLIKKKVWLKVAGSHVALEPCGFYTFTSNSISNHTVL